MTQRIGFIGIGMMGHGMAKNLLAKGYELTFKVNRNRSNLDDLLATGAREATTNADCASLGAFTCTTGFQTNICVPSCGAALDCGADVNSTPVGTDTWSYFTCTAGVCG